MASLDSLPPDQRAVLQLVLQRGRSYDQIAAMLSIDRAAVRDRALSAFDSIGPQTRVAPERRALITDYLMGQLPPRVAEQIHDRLGTSAPERAWARVLASELAPLARTPLPEIPSASSARGPAPAPEVEDASTEATTERPRRRTPAAAAVPAAGITEAATAGDTGSAQREERTAPGYGRRDPESPEDRSSSRRGGAILIALGVLVAAVVIIIVVATSGSDNNHTTSVAQTSPATTPTTPASTTSSTPTTGTSTTATQVVGSVNLTSPTGAKTPAGVAQVVKQGKNEGIVIVGQGVAANTKHNAYAVWLYNSSSDSHLLGFVNPAVKSDGKLQTAGVLPANASHYKELLVTMETQGKPAAPGQIVLQGALNLK